VKTLMKRKVWEGGQRKKTSKNKPGFGKKGKKVGGSTGRLSSMDPSTNVKWKKKARQKKSRKK